MDRPAGRREHDVARLPLQHLAVDGRAPGAVEVVIDGGGGVAVRPVDDLGRPYRHRGEERRRAAVGAPGHRIVEHVEAPADIVLAERLQLVEMVFDLLPRPVQRLRLHRRRVDQHLVGHETGALLIELDRSVGRDAAPFILLALLLVLDRLDRRRVLLHVMDVHQFEQRGVRVGESNLDVLAVIAMPIDMHGGRIPDVVKIHVEALAADDRVSAAANDEVDLGRVLPVGHGPLARQQDVERNLDAGCEAASALRARMRDDRAPAAVGGTR